MSGEQDELTELREQVANLETQIYTLKAMIKSARGLQTINPDPLQAWEVFSVLEAWSEFEVPSLPSPSNSESGQSGT